MDADTTLNQLEELTQRIGIRIRYEPLRGGGGVRAGGFCRIQGQQVVIINKKATAAEKVQVLVGALKRCDLEGIYMAPSLRELLDERDGRQHRRG